MDKVLESFVEYWGLTVIPALQKLPLGLFPLLSLCGHHLIISVANTQVKLYRRGASLPPKRYLGQASKLIMQSYPITVKIKLSICSCNIAFACHLDYPLFPSSCISSSWQKERYRIKAS